MLSIFADIARAQNRNITIITYLGPTTYKTRYGRPGNLPVSRWTTPRGMCTWDVEYILLAEKQKRPCYKRNGESGKDKTTKGVCIWRRASPGTRAGPLSRDLT